jgi:hypothetical protein
MFFDNNGQSISLISAFWYLLTIFMALLYWSTMWSTALLFLYFNFRNFLFTSEDAKGKAAKHANR